MTKTLSNGEQYVSVSEASFLLGVSIDTLRRWDKAGKLTSYRFNGKDRYFLKDSLIKFQEKRPLSIGVAAQLLEISEETLRRMDKKGILVATRDSNGERVYSKIMLQAFLRSWKRKKNVLSISQDTTPDKTSSNKFQKPYSLLQSIPLLRSRFCFIVVFFVFSLVVQMSQFHSG